MKLSYMFIIFNNVKVAVVKSRVHIIYAVNKNI